MNYFSAKEYNFQKHDSRRDLDTQNTLTGIGNTVQVRDHRGLASVQRDIDFRSPTPRTETERRSENIITVHKMYKLKLRTRGQLNFVL